MAPTSVSQRAATEERYLRPSQAAAMLHVSAQTVRRWAIDGKLPCIVTVGGHRRFPHSEVQRLRRQLQEEALRM